MKFSRKKKKGYETEAEARLLSYRPNSELHLGERAKKMESGKGLVGCENEDRRRDRQGQTLNRAVRRSNGGYCSLLFVRTPLLLSVFSPQLAFSLQL